MLHNDVYMLCKKNIKVCVFLLATLSNMLYYQHQEDCALLCRWVGAYHV